MQALGPVTNLTGEIGAVDVFEARERRWTHLPDGATAFGFQPSGTEELPPSVPVGCTLP